MKAFLLYPDRDLDLDAGLPPEEPDLTRDLGLDTLFDAMADGDTFIRDVAQRVMLASLTEPEEIVYRQSVLGDCLTHPDAVRELYAIAVDTINGERRVFGSFLRSPDSILRRSTDVLDLFVEMLHRLRKIGDDHAADFHSAGFTRFFEMLAEELDDTYFKRVQDHLGRLKFKSGVLVSASLGQGCNGTGYVLRRPHPRRRWRDRLTGTAPPSYTYRIPDRDEAGAQALSELRGQGLNLAADALARSADHILSFFTMLRRELGFYIGCLNLHEQLTAKGEPVCFPDPLPAGRPVLSCRSLHDICLALRRDGRVAASAWPS
ncbi:hypothetical protein [Streptomyces sp900116325]|uniref:hypothetical protein n=1 Tax=Streptomyces sp. 900116325 TaxID=3154295 RepID=UPI0033BA043F